MARGWLTITPSGRPRLLGRGLDAGRDRDVLEEVGLGAVTGRGSQGAGSCTATGRLGPDGGGGRARALGVSVAQGKAERHGEGER